MHVLIIGVGDAFTRRHFGSSALIQAPGGPILIDCPDLIHRAVHEAASKSGWVVEAIDVNDIIITHLHGDHSNGLESLGFARTIRRRRDPSIPRLRLHAVPPVASRVWEKLAPAMDGSLHYDRVASIDDYFELRELDIQDRQTTVAGLSVRYRFTNHPIPTVGLLLSDGHATLGWSSDTPFEPEHVDWLYQADLIVHESNLGPAHTPIEQLNGLPDAIRRKMCLIHLPDDFDASCTDMRPLVEGEVLEL